MVLFVNACVRNGLRTRKLTEVLLVKMGADVCM